MLYLGIHAHVIHPTTRSLMQCYNRLYRHRREIQPGPRHIPLGAFPRRHRLSPRPPLSLLPFLPQSHLTRPEPERRRQPYHQDPNHGRIIDIVLFVQIPTKRRSSLRIIILSPIPPMAPPRLEVIIIRIIQLIPRPASRPRDNIHILLLRQLALNLQPINHCRIIVPRGIWKALMLMLLLRRGRKPRQVLLLASEETRPPASEVEFDQGNRHG